MIVLLIAVSLVALASSAPPGPCPPFGEFLPWTDQCLFFPLANISKGVADACQTTFDKEKAGTGVQMPQDFQWPSRCGHCSFKARCRKREKQQGCYSLNLQKETCHEFGDVCTLQKHPKLGCRYNVLTAAARNCLNRPDLEDWRRDAIKEIADNLPQGNCFEKDGQCKCCCHPYTPNEDGTACVKHEEADCPAYGPFTEWSQCLWYPVKNLFEDVKSHCKLDTKLALPPNLLPLPANLQIPEKCGYCSFKARCRQREREDGCFHLDAEKKACGPVDCPTCGNVCTVDKLNGTCDFSHSLGRGLLNKVDEYAKALPYWRRRGIYDLARHLPYSKCKEVNNQCKCCCHPYEVSEDGTKCELTPMCSFVPSH